MGAKVARRWQKLAATMMGRHPIPALLAAFVLLLTLALVFAAVRCSSIGWCRKAILSASDFKKEWAARRLANDFAPESLKEAVPELLQVVETNCSHIADLCAEALGRLDPQTKKEVLPRLVRIVERQETSSMYSAAPEAVGKMGESAIPILIMWLKDNRLYYQQTATRGLKELRWSPLTDEERAWWLAAQGEWGRVVELGMPAFPVISERLVSEEGYYWEKRELVKALRESGPAGVPLLRAMASTDSRPRLSRLAASILTDVARSDQEAFDALAAILPSAPLNVRETLVAGLGTNPNKRAREVLYALLDEPAAPLRQSVAVALWKSGAFDELRKPGTERGIPKPLKYLVLADDPSWDVTTGLPEASRSSTFRQATVLVLVQYHTEKSSTWYWRGGPAKEGVLTLKIVDKTQEVLCEQSFSGGVIGYTGAFDQGGVGAEFVDQFGTPHGSIRAVSYDASKLKAKATTWLCEVLTR